MGATPWLPAKRISRGALDATATWQFVDAGGAPADPTDAGEVTATAVRSDGTTVELGTVTGAQDDPRSVTIALAEVATVDWITVTWSLAGIEVGSEVIEVVGPPILSPTAVKALDKSLSAKPNTEVLAAIRSVEDTATRAMNRSPFERFYRERVRGAGGRSLVVSWPDVIELVWARVWWSSTSFVDLTSDEVSAAQGHPGGMLVRHDGGVWPRWYDVEVGYRFGFPIPNDLRDKLVLAVRKALTQFTTGIPDRAVAMQTVEGFNVQLATPGTRNWTTGLPEVDEALNSYAFARIALA